MANRKVRSPLHDVDDPTSNALVQLTDESDGTVSPVNRSRLEGWTGTEWIKVAVDSAGNIATSAATAGPAANVTIVGSTITQPVSGAVSITGSTVPVSGTVTIQQAIASALQATISGAVTASVVATSITQPVSGSVSATIAATNVTQPVSVVGTVPVDGSGVTQPVSGSVSATIAATSVTQPVSGAISVTGTTLPITDNGGSITVDIGATAITQPISGAVSITGSTVPVTGSISVTGTTLPITDNGGSITVDGSVTVVQATAANLKVDASGATVPVSGSISVTATTVPITDNGGSLTVDNAGTFASQETQVTADNAAFTDGTTKVWPAGFVYDDSIESQTALTENDVGAARINVNRAVANVIEDGVKRGQYATVTPSGAVTVAFDPAIFEEIRDQLQLIVGILSN